MLVEALRAGLPVIYVRTTDELSARMVISHLTGCRVVDAPKLAAAKPGGLSPRTVAVLIRPTAREVEVASRVEFYDRAAKADASLVLVNPPGDVPPTIFDAGELPVPQPLLRNLIVGQLDRRDDPDEAFLSAVTAALGGLNLREALELLKIVAATPVTKRPRGRPPNVERLITPARVVEYRRLLRRASDTGLTLVDLEDRGYAPSDRLAEFARDEEPFFLSERHAHLRARGLLLSGPSGTGKTEAAKYIARRWGLPLYRVDAQVGSKWFGETEGNWARALTTVEREEPCVLLLDEVEKMMGGGDDGPMRRSLGYLLWWLAEHRARVLTVMTCNDVSSLPRELYRPGRVDLQIEFKLLTVVDDVRAVAEASRGWLGATPEDLDKALEPLTAGSQIFLKQGVTPAHVTSLIMRATKARIAGQLTKEK